MLSDGYAGNDFYVIVPDNCSQEHTNHSGAKVRITAQDGATGLLTLTSTGESTPFTVAAGGSSLVSLSDFHRLTQNDEVNNESYRLTTDNAVTVEVLDYDQYVSESWAVLPNTILGTEYVSSNYIGSGGFMSQIALVATTDNTVVTIRPSVICGSNRTPHVPFTVTLNHGQAYQLKSTQWDLTGTQITSTQPIGVVSGAQGARVPLEYGYGNPLEEQLLPFSRWQPEYVGIPFAHHPHARFRVTSARNRTHVSVYFGDTDTTSTYTLDAGQMQEIETTSPIWVTADKPIQGMQLSNGEALDFNFNDPASVGDPMMVTMPSTYSPNNMRSNWLTNAIIPVANDGFDYHYVTLISETHAMTTMYLNGNVINGWQGIGNTRFEYVRVALGPGNNVINGIYQGGAVGINFPARFIAYTNQFTESDAAGSIVGGLTVANDYVNVHPNDPTDLTATTVSASAIDLAWTGDSQAYGYRIERKTETGAWGQIADVTDGSITTYHNTGLHHKTKYYYRVVAYADEDSGYSNVAFATTFNEKPLMPTGLAALALSDSQIKLTWTDASDNEVNFFIQRSLDGQSGWTDVQTTDPDVTTWTDSNLTKKKTYYYRIKSWNSDMGDLGWTAPVSATTKDTKPTAPALTAVTGVSYNAIDLTWTDNSDNEDGFRIQRLDAAGQWQTVGTKLPNQTTFHDASGLQPSSSYTYQIVAYNNGGDSPSNSMSGSTQNPPAPEAPSGLVAEAVSDSQIQVSWRDNSQYELSFHIERSTDGINWNSGINVGANTTAYLDSGLAQVTSYIYRVQARNNSGNSNWSNLASATTEATPPPGTTAYLQDVWLTNDVLIGSNLTTQGTVKLRKTATSSTRVYLSSSNLGVSVPAYVDVAPGSRVASFTVSADSAPLKEQLYIYAKSGSWTQRTCLIRLSSISDTSAAVSTSGSPSRRIVSIEESGEVPFRKSILGFRVYRQVDGGAYSQITSSPTTDRAICDESPVANNSNVGYKVELIGQGNQVLWTSFSNSVNVQASNSNSSLTVSDSGTDLIVSFQTSNANGQDFFLVQGTKVITQIDAYAFRGYSMATVPKWSLSETNSAPLTVVSSPDATGRIVETNSVAPPSTSALRVPTSDSGIYRDEMLLPYFHIRTGNVSDSVTLTLRDAAGTVLNQVTGFGDDITWTWDGTNSSGSDVSEGDFNLSVDIDGSPSQSAKIPLKGVKHGEKFLAFLKADLPIAGEFTQRYAATVRTQIGRICARQPGLKATIYEFTSAGSRTTLSEKVIKKMIIDASYFYYYGHSSETRTPTDGEHTIFPSGTPVRNYLKVFAGGSSGAGIFVNGVCIPSFASQLHHKFAWIDACHTAGYDGSKPRPYNTTTPNYLWFTAFNMPMSVGCTLTWNGQIPYVASDLTLEMGNSQWIGQGTFREQLWIALGDGLSVDAAVTRATTRTPAGSDFGNWGYPWNILMQYGDTFHISLP
ncbi:MAG: fibronectin type III domain-containing protein [Armatimonadota bacterium]